MATKYMKQREDFKLAPLVWEWNSEDKEEESSTNSKIPAQPTCFIAPKTLYDVQQAKAAVVPKETSRDTQWCVKLWKTWTKERNAQTIKKIPEDITPLSDNALQQNLSVFILEVRKTDGTEYPPQTLHHIVCELMHHIRQYGGKPDINVFQDRAFADFCKTLNAKMKHLKQTRLGF